MLQSNTLNVDKLACLSKVMEMFSLFLFNVNGFFKHTFCFLFQVKEKVVKSR